MKRVMIVTVLIGLTLALSLVASSAFAALCVWVNPDRDIKNFFPGAKSYTTEMKTYTKAQGELIEKRLEAKLDPDENEFKFYRVKRDGKVTGTVLTHQARGKYGAVQVVVGIGTDKKVIGVYVQRHREPTNLNKASFLKQFKGKDANDPIEVGKDITAINGHDKSSQAVAFSVKKILVVHDVLSK
ncbi:MAG: Electron transport complex subunit RsxG [bacterium ADurb.Bin429]|nr:MAG: Electron transport complex subunit RsxG [bacterium ADurb.Bin429]